MKKTVVIALIAGLMVLSAGGIKQDGKNIPTPQIENVSENITPTENEVVSQDIKNIEIEEDAVSANSELTSAPMNQVSDSSSASSSSSSSSGRGSSSSSSSGSNTGGSSSGGFDIAGSDEVIDYGTVCGTCGGLWDEVSNRCWHCNPK